MTFLPQSQVFPKGYDALLVFLTKFYTDVASCVNAREIAFYDLIETFTGQQWFSVDDSQGRRGAFRKVVSFASPLVSGVNSEEHGIDVSSDFCFFFDFCNSCPS